MKIADFNIRATPPQRSKRVRRDLGLALSLCLHVYCWQELGKFRRYIRILKSVFAEDKWEHLFLRERNIISVRRRVHTVVMIHTVILSKAAPWIPQPSRRANAALLKDHKGRYDWVVNFHLTNDKEGRRHPLTRKVRLQRWNDEVSGLQDFIQELLDIADVPVWLCADSNSKEMPRLHKDQFDCVGEPPMHVSVIWTGRARSIDWHARTIPETRLNTDHAALIVEEK